MRSREGVDVINFTRNMLLCYMSSAGPGGPFGEGVVKEVLLQYSCNV
jgi:hypothetical protein